MPPLVTNTPFSGPGPLTDAWDPARSYSGFGLSGMTATMNASTGGSEYCVTSLVSVTSGKHYVEVSFSGSVDKIMLGVASPSADWTTRPTAFRTGWYMFMERLLSIYFNNTNKESGLPVVSSPVTWGLLVDMDNYQMSILDNAGSNLGSGPWSSLPATDIRIAAGFAAQTDTLTANFGGSPFVHTVPGGYNPGWPGYF